PPSHLIQETAVVHDETVAYFFNGIGPLQTFLDRGSSSSCTLVRSREPQMLRHHHVIEGEGLDPAPLLLLHGSGGTEHDMVPIAGQLAPTSMAISIRGAVPWEGGYAFFRRLEDRSVDERDLLHRADRLAEDIADIERHYHLPKPPIAIGFSNGAIMAAALVMLYPRCLSGAILLRPLSPLADDPKKPVPGIPVLVIDGHHDERRMPGDGARLAQRMERMGAVVTHHVLSTGHPVIEDDVRLARQWLRSRF
uniref:alpha/beta hydrolase n=1 Tax=Bradyrhizobium sp. SZCCHNRI3037 TaxID=3057290 RepID=UPI0029160E46